MWEGKFSSRGFTLVELLLVVGLLGILSTVALVAVDPGARIAQARDVQRKADLRQIANALDTYYIDHEEYPHPCALVQGFGECASANLSQWPAELNVLLEEGYLKTLAADPVNNAFASVFQTNGLSYFYVSWDDPSVGAVAGKYYILGAFLERDDDPLMLGNLGGGLSRPKWPDCSTDIGFDGRAYLLRSYQCPNDPEGSL